MSYSEVADAIVAQVDLRDVVSETVELVRAGKEFKALCPFHGEKSPSFYVVPHKKFWKCFGCGAGGDVIAFVAARDNISEIEAAKRLVEERGVEIPDDMDEDWHLTPLERSRIFLRKVGARMLSGLLEHTTYSVESIEDGFLGERQVVQFRCSKERAEALRLLPDSHKERILRALSMADPSVSEHLGAGQLVIQESGRDPDPLLPTLIAQQNLMIDVATGGARIKDVNDYYMLRRASITEGLAALGIQNPNPHGDLWDWYRHWRDEEWGYEGRRRYVWDMFDPIIERMVDPPPAPVPIREPTGWERVDRGVDKARNALERAQDEEDFQGIGLLSREILISLAQAVFDPAKHPSQDGKEPSNTDAARMLENFIAVKAEGSRNEGIRRHAKAVLKLAVELQHKRTADFRIAALCLEATSSLVNVVAILKGRRDR